MIGCCAIVPHPYCFKWDPPGISFSFFFPALEQKALSWLALFALWAHVYSPLTLGSFFLSKVAWEKSLLVRLG